MIDWRKVIFSSELFSVCEFDPMTILPDLVIEQVSITNEVTVIVCAASPTAPCPASSDKRHLASSKTERVEKPGSGHVPLESKEPTCAFG